MLEPRPGTTDDLVIKEIWEENVYQVFQTDVEGQTVLDLGANIGAFSLYVRDLGAKRVVAVEPHPDNFLQLLANRKPRIELHELAVAETSGTVGVYGTGGTGFTQDAISDFSARSLSLEDMWDEFRLDQVAVVKMDIEGAEYEVLRSAPASVLERIGYMTIEFHSPPMMDGREPSATFGQMLTRICEHFNTHVVGAPSRGGMIYARAY
jgi:FkbM family methyltransferase